MIFLQDTGELLLGQEVYESLQDTKDDPSTASVNEGEIVALLGPNGSGKSTIAKLLIGLLEPNENSITAFGEVLNNKSIHRIRQRIGIVFQNPDNQFVGSTVADDIAFGLENRCVPQKDMDKIINEFAWKVHMQDFLDKEPDKLSGGQKQRVAIAGVLAMKPDVIIFDEATAMLDPKGKKEVRETIYEMRKENSNLTIISITHDLEEAFSADEIIVLNKGKVYMNGTPEEILLNRSKLRDAGLDVPFKTKLTDELNKLGVNVNSSESLERIVEELCR